MLPSVSPSLPLSFAESAFREAEALQQEIQPQYPLLYSLQGYRYCELLLAEFEESKLQDVEGCYAQICEVRKRAETTLEWADENRVGLLDFALNHLTLGRTWVAEAELRRGEISNPKSQLAQAKHHLNESVSLLRQASDQTHLPRGLLHRAALWRVGCALAHRLSVGGRADDMLKHNLQKAERDLSEAESIAARGSMLIWQIEAALERTRLYLVLHKCATGSASAPPGSTDTATALAEPVAHSEVDWLRQAQEKLDEAKRSVKQTEKPYEPHLPESEEWDPPEYVGVFKKGEIVGYHCRNAQINALQATIDRAG